MESYELATELTKTLGSQWPRYIAVRPNWSDNGCTTGFVGFRSEVALEQFINQNPEFRVFRLDNRWFMD